MLAAQRFLEGVVVVPCVGVEFFSVLLVVIATAMLGAAKLSAALLPEREPLATLEGAPPEELASLFIGPKEEHGIDCKKAVLIRCVRAAILEEDIVAAPHQL